SGCGLPTQRPLRRFTPSWPSNAPRIMLLATRPCPVEFTEQTLGGPKTFSIVHPMALEMRARCERCGAELQPTGDAYICTYECTFCAPCAATLAHVCPNCRGELVRRPRRLSSRGA